MQRFWFPALSGAALTLGAVFSAPALAATYIVPAGVVAVDVTLSGGSGGGGGSDSGSGGAGGAGAAVTARIAVTPGQVMTYVAGQAGGAGARVYCTAVPPSTGGAAGAGDGAGGQGGPTGDCATTGYSGEGGAGGGASSVMVGGTVIRAGGGGGGGGGSNGQTGGAGGDAPLSLTQTAACQTAGAGQNGQGYVSGVDGGGGGGGGGSYNGGQGTGGIYGIDSSQAAGGGTGGASCYWASAGNPILSTPAMTITASGAGGAGGTGTVTRGVDGTDGSISLAPVLGPTPSSTPAAAVPTLNHGALAPLGLLLAALALPLIRRRRGALFSRY